MRYVGCHSNVTKSPRRRQDLAELTRTVVQNALGAPLACKAIKIHPIPHRVLMGHMLDQIKSVEPIEHYFSIQAADLDL